jgi:hypothetical protein
MKKRHGEQNSQERIASQVQNQGGQFLFHFIKLIIIELYCAFVIA